MFKLQQSNEKKSSFKWSSIDHGSTESNRGKENSIMFL